MAFPMRRLAVAAAIGQRQRLVYIGVRIDSDILGSKIPRAGMVRANIVYEHPKGIDDPRIDNGRQAPSERLRQIVRTDTARG
jgi:hypothetical protein